MTGGRAGRGGKEGWSFGGFLSSLPRTTCIFSFMGYGFCSSGWVSDLTEWYQTRNRLLKAFRLLRKVCARQLSVSQESARNFLKLLEFNVLVCSCAFASQPLTCRVEIAKHACMRLVLLSMRQRCTWVTDPANSCVSISGQLSWIGLLRAPPRGRTW